MGNGSKKRVICSKAIIRLFLHRGSQVQPLMLFCPARAGDFSHRNRDWCGSAERRGHAQIG